METLFQQPGRQYSSAPAHLSVAEVDQLERQLVLQVEPQYRKAVAKLQLAGAVSSQAQARSLS